MFECSGLDAKEVTLARCDIGGLKIHPQYAGYSQEDLQCTILTLVHQKVVGQADAAAMYLISANRISLDRPDRRH